LNKSADRLPAPVLGLMTMVATWQPASFVLAAQLPLPPPSPSSQVRKTAVVAFRYSALSRMPGRFCASQVSPSTTVPSCMSLMRLGVMNEKAGSVLWARSTARAEYGTSTVEHPERVA
jgi:hypothetical protein